MAFLLDCLEAKISSCFSLVSFWNIFGKCVGSQFKIETVPDSQAELLMTCPDWLIWRTHTRAHTRTFSLSLSLSLVLANKVAFDMQKLI